MLASADQEDETHDHKRRERGSNRLDGERDMPDSIPDPDAVQNRCMRAGEQEKQHDIEDDTASVPNPLLFASILTLSAETIELPRTRQQNSAIEKRKAGQRQDADTNRPRSTEGRRNLDQEDRRYQDRHACGQPARIRHGDASSEQLRVQLKTLTFQPSYRRRIERPCL